MAPPAVQSRSATVQDAGDGRLQGPFGMSRSDAEKIANRVVEDHRRGKQAAYYRMLTAQKYAYHIDGEGDAQWADIKNGTQVKIPKRRKGALRHQDNILRPMVDYWIAYFCSQPLHAVAEHRADRKGRDRARIDTIVANDHLHKQRINDRAAEAMYMAAFNGWGITHSMWRNDVLQDSAEVAGPYSKSVVVPGYTDVFPGNPFDTIFASTATRYSIPWYSYGRTLPTALVRDAFPEAPNIEKLEGSDTEPSTSWWQRMLRRWEFLGLSGGIQHGSAALVGTGSSDDSVALVCREIMPGQLRAHPGGLLIIVALNGASETGGIDGSAGKPTLVHIGPLPGGVSSGTLFYALSRGDDVNGKAYAADIDDDQTRLNQAITMYAELLSQFAYPQLFLAQGSQLLNNQKLGDKIIEYISQPGQPPPQYQFPGAGANFVAALSYIKDIRESAFRKGGWQASSRGETSGANEPAARAQFLAAQDKMIFAPTAISFRSSIVELCRKNHALRKRFQNLPLLVDTIGADLGYMAETYIHKQDMSPSPPDFSLVSGFGSTPQERLDELKEMVVLRGGDGQPILTVKRFWQLHPDQALRPMEPDIEETRRRRAQAINIEIERLVDEYRETPTPSLDPVAEIADKVFQKFPPLRTDAFALQLLVESLDVLVQDPTIDPLARDVALKRIDYLLEWQMQINAQAAPPAGDTTQQAPAGAAAA